MSFFKKVLSKVGIGAVKVDCMPAVDVIIPGSVLPFKLHVTGGSVEQVINKIDVALVCTYQVMVKNSEGEESELTDSHELIKITAFSETTTVQPDDSFTVDCSIDIPHDTPLTLGKTKVYLDTDLDIDAALDGSDHDNLAISPNEQQLAVLTALEELGFEMSDAECEASEKSFGELPFIQEFEFKASRGEFYGKLDELEVVWAYHNSDTLDIYLEIDRKARGLVGLLAEVLDMDESQAYLEITNQDIDTIRESLAEIIRHNAG